MSVIVSATPVLQLPPPAAERATGSEAMPARRTALRLIPWHYLFLFLLTLFAGYARFAWIGHPALWGDEAHTYSRTGGEYRELLDILQVDGFVPLHYSLYWVIVQMCRMGPLGRMLIRVIGASAAAVIGWPLIYLVMRRWLGLAGSMLIGLLGAAAIGGGTLAMLTPLSAITFVTPGVMRFVPALAGTLMVPAIYFLAVQIVRREVALAAALFTACSAYMFVYSHDAKMYMHAWLLGTLSVACLLWWIRTRKRIAWLCWMATGLGAVGLHASGMILPPVELVIMLSCSRPWRAAYWRNLLLFLLGFIVIMAGPAGYYAGFNRWAERVDEIGWEVSGINWVQEYNQGRTGPDLVKFAATAHVYSWEWPKAADRAGINIYTLNVLMLTGMVVMGLALIGAMGWPKRLRTDGALQPVVKVARAGSTGSLQADLAALRQPWWRQLLWLSVWIILPAYGFYCRSMEQFVAPSRWWREVAEWFSGKWAYIALDVAILIGVFILLRLVRPVRWILLGAFALAVGKLIWAAELFNGSLGDSPAQRWWHVVAQWPAPPRGFWVLAVGAGLLAGMLWWRSGPTLSKRLVRSGLFAAMLMLIVGIIWAGVASGSSFQAAWNDAAQWPARLDDAGIIAAILLAAGGLSWWYCGATIAQRCKKGLQLAAVAAVVYGGCWVVYWGVNLVWERAVAKVLVDRSDRRIAEDWDSRVGQMLRSHGVPTMQEAMAAVRADEPRGTNESMQKMADDRIAAAKAKWDGMVWQYAHQDPPVAQFEAEKKAAERLAAEGLVWEFKWDSRWMPRYLGMIWPAVAIALCALLMRLPGRPLRWSAVALVLLLNLGQAYGRMFAGNEPPMDQIERDINASQSTDASGAATVGDTRTYAQLGYSFGGHPGSLGLSTPAARYYLMVERRHWLSPIQFRNEGMSEIDHLFGVVYPEYPSVQLIAHDVRNDAKLRRLIIWEQVGNDPDRLQKAILGALPDGWRIESQVDYKGRMHWWWKDLYTLRRVEIVRK